MKENKKFNVLKNLDLIIAMVSLIALILTTFVGVIMRYFLSNPFTWLEEFQLWSFLWLVFFGSGVAFRSGSHVAIDIIVDMMPDSLKKIVKIAGYFIVIAVLLYFIYHGINLVKQLASTGRVSNILKVPYSLIYSALPIGCILMIINYTIVTIIDIRELTGRKNGGSVE